MEIFQCEINPLLEKFFEAPEPKEEDSKASSGGGGHVNRDMALNGADDDGEVLTDDLGAATSDDKDNDLDFDSVFSVKNEDKKAENTFSFDTTPSPAAAKEEDKKEEATSAATNDAPEEGGKSGPAADAAAAAEGGTESSKSAAGEAAASTEAESEEE